ncbi:hypothetical protein Zm00014a_009859 [Zea mays]|uniref:Uncharacterized protein n=1 Tax=Zea mays TaxID=4577 RepID=A0A3L6EV27_MAIZE|nr:hypothetical protein Zm00014a_009859 [Zea mays]
MDKSHCNERARGDRIDSLTGAAEGDGRRVESRGDVGRRLDVQHDELAVGAQAEVVERPLQRVHALLAAVYSHHHARQVAGRHGELLLRLGLRRSFSSLVCS